AQGFGAGAVSASVVDGKLRIVVNAANIAQLNLLGGSALGFAADQRSACEGEVSFKLRSDDGSRLYVDGELVVDNDGAHSILEATHTVTLSGGYHDIRVEYIENLGAATLQLLWDPAGGSSYVTVPAANLVRADARPGNAIGAGGDLVVSYNNGPSGAVAVIAGRPRADWNAGVTTATQTFGLAGANASSVGDVTGDGIDDFAIFRAADLRIYAGSDKPSGPTLAATITAAPGTFAGLQVRAAGHIDGDRFGDILITGPSGGYLLMGGDLANAAIGTLTGAGKAFALPEGEFRGIGDFDGDGFDDLGAATLLTTDRLNE